MLKILWKRGEIAPEEQLLLLSTIFSYLMLDIYVKTRIRFSLRDKRLFEITEVEITRVDCKLILCFIKFFTLFTCLGWFEQLVILTFHRYRHHIGSLSKERQIDSDIIMC